MLKIRILDIKNDSELNKMISSGVSDWATYKQNYQALLSIFGINKLRNREVSDSYIDEFWDHNYHTSESLQ